MSQREGISNKDLGDYIVRGLIALFVALAALSAVGFFIQAARVQETLHRLAL